MQGDRPSAKDNRRRSFERSDEAVINQLKRNDRVWRFMILGFLVSLVSSIVLFLMGRFGVVPQVIAEYLAVAPLIVWLLATIYLFGRNYAPAPESYEERILRKRIDAVQSVWRWIMVAAVFTAFTTTLSTSFALGRNIRYPLLALIAGGSVAIVILIYALAAFYGPGYLGWKYRIASDELDRALHARAFKTGYLAMMIMVAGTLPVILYRPALTAQALCWVLFVGFAMPTLYYVILQWRVGSGD
jgi:membrane protein YdbS with pleckstrin-like domain